MQNLHSRRSPAPGHDKRPQEFPSADGVPGPRERYWRLFAWIAIMVLLGAALSLLSRP